MTRQFTFLWAIVLILALFATSGAGYYAQESYRAYLEKGYYLTSIEDETSSPLAAIGTIASILLVPMAVMSLPRRMNPFIIAFLLVPVWVAVSAVWSNVLVASLTAAGKTAVYILGINAAVKYLDHRQVARCVAVVALLICGISLFLGLTDPIFRMSIGAEGWRGLFAQKNRFAMFALFSIFLMFPEVFRRDMRIVALLTLVVLVSCLIVSQGKTALGIAVVYMITTASFVFLSGKAGTSKRSLVGMSLVLVSVLVAAAVIIGLLISLGGVTFTGRVDLWRWFFSDLGDKLLVGTGGVTAPADPAFFKRALSMNRPPTSDSSYVMLLYNQGVVGFMLYFAAIAIMWTRCVKIGGDYAIFAIVTLASYVVFAFFESDARLNLSYPSIGLLLQLLLLEKRGLQAGLASKVRRLPGSSSRRAAQRPGPTLAG